MALSSAGVREADELMQEYDARNERWRSDLLVAKNEPKLQQKLIESRPSPRRTTQKLMHEISSLLDQPACMRAVAWIYKNDPTFLIDSGENNYGSVIRNSLKNSLYKHAGAGELCLTISENFSPLDMPFLEKVAQHSPHKEEQGLALLSLSGALSHVGDEPELIAKRLTHLRKAIELIPSNAQVGEDKVSDIISDQIYVIQNLTKGRRAPEFSGVDLGQRPVSLSEAEGKVTAILFWTDVNMQEDSLIETFQNTQKTLEEVGGKMIGVYSGDRSTLSDLVIERQITWTNAYDVDRSITNQYRINKTPTFFVLDKKGQIQNVSEPNSLVNLTIRALANSSE